MKNRKNKPMIEYLEIDENTYIENDKLKTKINESNNPPKFVSWDEFWDNVRA